MQGFVTQGIFRAAYTSRFVIVDYVNALCHELTLGVCSWHLHFGLSEFVFRFACATCGQTIQWKAVRRFNGRIPDGRMEYSNAQIFSREKIITFKLFRVTHDGV